MSSIPSLDITVIYADDRRTAPGVRRPAAARAATPSRIAACLTLIASAAWMFVVWFPVERYLYLCVAMRTPGIWLPAELDLNKLIFGGPPPAEFAVRGPATGTVDPTEPEPEAPNEEGISAYRSPAPTTAAPPIRAVPAQPPPAREHWRTAIYSWLGLTTAAGLSMALVAGAGLSNWSASPSSARPLRWVALVMSLVVAGIAFYYWPRGGQFPRIPMNIQLLLVAALAVLAGAVCASSTPRLAARLFAVGVVLFGIVAWTLWGVYQTGLPDTGKRVFPLSLMVPAALLGAALARSASRLQGLAIVAIVLAGLATMLGLFYGLRVAGFVEPAPTAATYGKALAVCGCALIPLIWSRRSLN